MTGERKQIIQSILDKVAEENTLGLPVIMMAHQAVTGLDVTGHDFEIGKIKTMDEDAFGNGFDYLALGHIHKPQTIGHQMDAMNEQMTYKAPVVRYSGSALHVSCDETYPHTVSLVEIDRHMGDVNIRQLRIDELRHFYVLPLDGSSFKSSDEALECMKKFVSEGERGYIRFCFNQSTNVPSNFNQLVYDALQPYDEEWRYNPKILWTGIQDSPKEDKEQLVFQVAELQQMKDPMEFIERTKSQYPGLDLNDVRQAFDEVREEIRRMEEEKETKTQKKTKDTES
jgi:exonuclease SbcD